MPSLYSHRVLSAILILNLQDEFARALVGKGYPRPIEPLRFYLVGAYQGGNLQKFPEPVRLLIQTNADGYHLFFGQERVDERTKRNMFLRDGEYQVRVESPYYQTAEKRVYIPVGNLNFPPPGSPDPTLGYTISLQPGPAYPFPDLIPLRMTPGAGCNEPPAGGRRGPTLLRGSLQNFDGKPIEQATISVAGVPIVGKSGMTGDWVLWFPDSQNTGPVTVRIEIPEQGSFNLTGVCVIRGCEMSLSQTSLRGWVTRQGVGIGGIRIAISGQPQSVLTTPTGEWRFYFPLDFSGGQVTVTAALPNGTNPRQQIQSIARASVIVPTFRF